MNKGIVSLLYLSLVVLMPACKQGDEGKMKKEKVTRSKTEKKTTRKKKDGQVVEETKTMKTESKQQPMK